MGIPLDIFTLHRLQGTGEIDTHHLLLRVVQPEFSNADQTSFDHAVRIAEEKQKKLIELYISETLRDESSGSFTVTLVGELQRYPVGDEFFAEHGRFDVDLWIAGTRFGYPWVIMGMAASEELFWQRVEEDADLVSLGGQRPATCVRAFFMTENDINRNS